MKKIKLIKSLFTNTNDYYNNLQEGLFIQDGYCSKCKLYALCDEQGNIISDKRYYILYNNYMKNNNLAPRMVYADWYK